MTIFKYICIKLMRPKLETKALTLSLIENFHAPFGSNLYSSVATAAC